MAVEGDGIETLSFRLDVFFFLLIIARLYVSFSCSFFLFFLLLGIILQDSSERNISISICIIY